MVRVILGLVKGLAVGGGLGYLLLYLHIDGGGPLAYAACAVVGALVGVIAGRAPWRADTIWTPVVKALVGAAIGAGLCFAGRRFLPDLAPTIAGVGTIPLRGATFLSAAIGVLYGIFVEVDDGGGADDKDKKSEERALPARK